MGKALKENVSVESADVVTKPRMVFKRLIDMNIVKPGVQVSAPYVSTYLDGRRMIFKSDKLVCVDVVYSPNDGLPTHLGVYIEHLDQTQYIPVSMVEKIEGMTLDRLLRIFDNARAKGG